MTSATPLADDTDLQQACEEGQRLLMETRYLQAESVLMAAERLAWDRRDFDTLARLYMPLQETRRQIRQRCGEGIVRLNIVPNAWDEVLDVSQIVEQSPHGQLLVAGWGTIEPALRVRELAREKGLYVETFLAAIFPVNGSGRVVAVVPDADVALPAPILRNVDELMRKLPPHSIVMSIDELSGGSTQTFAETMAWWERLHLPFLNAADLEVEALRKIDAYRRTIRVDNACELAHQKLSAVAHELGRAARNTRRTSGAAG